MFIVAVPATAILLSIKQVINGKGNRQYSSDMYGETISPVILLGHNYEKSTYRQWPIGTWFTVFVVSVIWNGTVIDGPILIYHDEITMDNDAIPTAENSRESGELVCRSENHEQAHWYHSNEETGDYQQVQSLAGSLPSWSQLYIDNLTLNVNGLWVCALNNTVLIEQYLIDSFIYVGIYRRNRGEFG